LREDKPINIINFGTAGSSRSDLKGLHEVTTFKQRDMDLRDIGLPLGVTLNDDINDITLDRPGLSCGTGDNFVTASQEIKTDLYDMEAYALAKLCLKEKINYFCFKYISDEANETASEDWSKNVSMGGKAFQLHISIDSGLRSIL
jgi:adenosylhomocysteine nucleosidase